MINKLYIKHSTIAITIFFSATIFSFVFFLPVINSDPIVADGRQNLSVATNIINHAVFSSQSPPLPDMVREPAWPALTAAVILFFSLQNKGIEDLSTIHSELFKKINATIYSIMIGFIAAYIYLHSRKQLYSLFVFIFSLVLFGTMPRLINYLNNEALASILVLLSSTLLLKTFKCSSSSSALALGIAYGILALTKAQFLYIVLVPIAILFLTSKRQATFTFIAFVLIVSPWIIRNYLLFEDVAISKRGKTVAAVRLVMTAEPTTEEHDCMAFAFSHPKFRSRLGNLLSLDYQDFIQGGKCEKFNRELCYDMGTEKVKCAPFPEDLAPGTWDDKIQYFYRGFSAGRAIEADLLKFQDIAVVNHRLLMKYFETLPLFAWRGVGFSDYPLFSIFLTISLFMLIFTSLWPFALLAIVSHAFHILFTHNMPRYHSIELGVMIFSAVYLVDRTRLFLSHFIEKKTSIRHTIF